MPLFILTLHLAYSKVGEGNLVLSHSVSHFPPNSAAKKYNVQTFSKMESDVMEVALWNTLAVIIIPFVTFG